MKVRFKLTRTLRWVQWLLFSGAAVMIAYCGLVLADSWIFQKAQRRELERRLTDRGVPVAMERPVLATVKGLIGRIEIPRIGLSAMVMEGDDSATLRHAAGHIPGTALPGQRGNAGISGHRDTLFRPLRNVRTNDTITITTFRGDYRYQVVSTQVVDPNDVSVLDSGDIEALTLVTCYPFYFVGPAPGRFVVRAVRAQTLRQTFTPAQP